MQKNDFQVIHEGDQERAESLALGDLRICFRKDGSKGILVKVITNEWLLTREERRG